MFYRALWLAGLLVTDALILWGRAPTALEAAAIGALAFILPGIAAVAVLFPRADELDVWERVCMGGAVGLALSLQATWLYILAPGGLSMPILLGILNGMTLALGAAALWRLSRTPASDPLLSLAPRADRRENASATFLIGLAIVFTFLLSGYTEYDHDEVAVISAAVGSIVGMERAVFTLLKGPSQFISAAIFALLGGDVSEEFLRAPFGIAGILGTLALWRLSRRLAGAGAALVVLALWVVEGIHTGQNRWLQFQSLLLLNGIAAVWCYARALNETGSLRARLHLLGAFLFGAGLFAHFDGAFTAPVLVFLWWLAEREALRRRGTWLRAGMLALIIALVTAPFYSLMIRQPGLSARLERYYFGLRIGDPPYNSMGGFIGRLAMLESPLWLLMIIAGLLLAGTVIGIAYTGRAAVRGVLWWIAFGSAVLVILFPALLVVSGVNLSFVPFAALALQLALLDGPAVHLRLAGVWAVGAWFYPAFWMQVPGDHFFVALPGICLLVVAAWQETWRLAETQTTAWRNTRFALGGAAVFALWLTGAALYIFLMFVWHQPEYAMLYPEAKPPLTLFAVERPPLLYGAYPHQSGWRAIAVLYARGELRGEYVSNELHAISDWYLQKQWEPDQLRPRYYFEVVRPFAPILGSDVPPDLAQTHRLAGVVTVEGEPRMRIHARRAGDDPLPVQTWEVESLADSWHDMAALSRFVALETSGRDDTAFYSIARRLEREGQPGDVVLLDGALGRGLLAKFYTGNLPLVNSLDSPEARTAKRIWGVFWASPDQVGERAIAEHTCPAASEWHKNVRLTLNGTGATGEARTIGAQFDAHARLESVATSEAVRGGILCVQFHWETLAPTGTPYKVFVHLLAADGKVVAQFDTEPLAGFEPTTRWHEGERFLDRVGILLPTNLPAGEYRLAVGFYSPASGQRLPAILSGARQANDAVQVATVSLR